MTKSLIAAANDLFEYTRGLRRDIHQHPELGFQEYRTAGIVARELTRLGLEVKTEVADTGVVAVMRGGQPGPTVLLRFDMDALPIQEETGLDFASQVPGVMHACGHDGHVAVGLTTARLLNGFRPEIKGNFKFMFQPAEEGLGGAERMIAEGVLEDPPVDAALALHLWNERPVGWVGVVPGPFMAGGDFFAIRLKGKGGHGAIPDQAVDPVIAAAEMISALQSIVSRNISPLNSAVLSVTQVAAGNTFNVIPAEAEIRGTIRTFEVEVRNLILQRFETLVRNLAAGFGCEVEIDLQQLTPAVFNDPAVTAWAEEAIRITAPESQIDRTYRTMVSEDMAFVLQKVPGCYLFAGSGLPDPKLNYGHHHPKFTIDERVLPQAAAMVSAAALEVLQRLNTSGSQSE
jgi:amidohydrolase